MNRGGGWNDDARRCRPAFRGGREPAYRSNNQGFRVASSSVDASSK
jgi:formylglycine-generating enzyme required for sulfatase activity